ncbi:MAG: contractile injection system tape measure protein [Bacteroidota bacterium]
MINQHYIGKQVFDLKLFKQEDAFALQQKLGNAYWSVVKDRLDQLFSELSHPEELIQIDRLEIDLGNVAEHEVERVLADRIIEQLQEALENEILQARLFSEPAQQSQLGQFRTWLHFLEYGLLPWNSTNQLDAQTWFIQAIETIASNTVSLERFRQRIIQRPVIVSRLIKQYSTDELALLMEAISGEKRTSWRGLHDLLRHFTSQQAVKLLLESASQERLKTALASLGTYSQQEWSYYFWTQAIHHYLVQRKRSQWEAFSTELIFSQLHSSKKDIVQLLLLSKRQLTLQAEEKRLLQAWIQYLPTSGAIQPQEALEKPIDTPVNTTQASSEHPFERDDVPADSRTNANPLIDGVIDSLPASPGESQTNNSADTPLGEVQEDKGQGREESSEEQLQSNVPATDDQSPVDNPIDVPIKEAQSAPALTSSTKSGTDEEAPEAPNSLVNETQSSAISPEGRDEAAESLLSQPPENQSSGSIEERWQNYLQAVKDGQIVRSNMASVNAITAEQQQLEKEGIYLSNAGLVLIHPFLLPYFENVDLVKEGEFLDPQAQEKAVHLLAYLATKEEGLPEYKLSLPKLLCGLPLSWPIEKAIELGEEEKLEGERLLEAAVKHWGALGDVSPDALREGFLQRDGKLVKKNEDWILTVEQKTMDVLLDKLPFGWGVSMIKLPWMNELLKVNWI